MQIEKKYIDSVEELFSSLIDAQVTSSLGGTKEFDLSDFPEDHHFYINSHLSDKCNSVELSLKYYEMLKIVNKLEKLKSIQLEFLISEIVAEDFDNWNMTKNKGIDNDADKIKFIRQSLENDYRVDDILELINAFSKGI